MRMALPVPLARERTIAGPRPAPDLIARKTLMQSVAAWGITYMGVLAGISLLSKPMDIFNICLMVAFIVGAPIAGIALAFTSMRRSLKSLQMMPETAGGRVMGVVTLITSLSFFIVPMSVVTAVSLWAFILPTGG